MKSLHLYSVVLLLLIGISAQANITLDLTTAGSSGSTGGAYFEWVNQQSTGTGVIQSFVRIQDNGTEKGYNTDGALSAATTYDTKGGLFTHSLLLTDIPVVKIGGVDYRQFLLDINENKGGSHEYLSLDTIEIYQDDSGSNTGYPNLGTLIYDMDATSDNGIKLNYELNPGSGAGDMFAYIPDALFIGKTYVYFYSEFGEDYESDAGPEEWAVFKSSTPIVPVPGAILLGSMGVGIVGWMRRKRAF